GGAVAAPGCFMAPPGRPPPPVALCIGSGPRRTRAGWLVGRSIAPRKWQPKGNRILRPERALTQALVCKRCFRGGERCRRDAATRAAFDRACALLAPDSR